MRIRYGNTITNHHFPNVCVLTEIRKMSRLDVPSLFEVISQLPPHGHRNWRVADEDQLDATLSESRIIPENGAWSLAFKGETPCGYSLTEPELNIGRIVVGCAVTAGNEDFHTVMLSDAIARAEDIADDDSIQIQIAVQTPEPEYVTANVMSAGLAPVREFVKMRGKADTADSSATTAADSGTVLRARLDDHDEIVAVTDLHNLCFEGSWGFSPNTYDEISERVNNDFERTGIPPILTSNGDGHRNPSAYVWTTMHESDGRIEMIGVRPDKRRAGLGRQIFGAGVRHLIEHGAETISLEVDTQNSAAIRLYESVGLSEYSRTVYYGRSA